MGALKEAVKIYREIKADEKLRKRLLLKSLDYDYLTKIIGKVSDNPDVRIDIQLADGTKLTVRADHYTQKNIPDYQRIYEE